MTQGITYVTSILEHLLAIPSSLKPKNTIPTRDNQHPLLSEEMDGRQQLAKPPRTEHGGKKTIFRGYLEQI
jgi:hypothetical protein